jgi:hypothetical protein
MKNRICGIYGFQRHVRPGREFTWAASVKIREGYVSFLPLGCSALSAVLTLALLQKAEMNHKAQSTQRSPLNFFVIFVFFAVEKALCSGGNYSPLLFASFVSLRFRIRDTDEYTY